MTPSEFRDFIAKQCNFPVPVPGRKRENGNTSTGCEDGNATGVSIPSGSLAAGNPFLSGSAESRRARIIGCEADNSKNLVVSGSSAPPAQTFPKSLKDWLHQTTVEIKQDDDTN